MVSGIPPRMCVGRPSPSAPWHFPGSQLVRLLHGQLLPLLPSAKIPGLMNISLLSFRLPGKEPPPIPSVQKRPGFQNYVFPLTYKNVTAASQIFIYLMSKSFLLRT